MSLKEKLSCPRWGSYSKSPSRIWRMSGMSSCSPSNYVNHMTAAGIEKAVEILPLEHSLEQAVVEQFYGIYYLGSMWSSSNNSWLTWHNRVLPPVHFVCHSHGEVDRSATAVSRRLEPRLVWFRGQGRKASLLFLRVSVRMAPKREVLPKNILQYLVNTKQDLLFER